MCKNVGTEVALCHWFSYSSTTGASRFGCCATATDSESWIQRATAFGWRTSRPEGAAVIDARSGNAKRPFCSEEKTMKLRDQATNAQNMRPSRFRSDVPEERGENLPTPDEIRRRVLEIHIEHGGHDYD